MSWKPIIKTSVTPGKWFVWAENKPIADHRFIDAYGDFHMDPQYFDSEEEAAEAVFVAQLKGNML